MLTASFLEALSHRTSFWAVNLDRESKGVVPKAAKMERLYFNKKLIDFSRRYY